MRIKSIALTIIALCVSTAAASAHAGNHSHADGTANAAHFFSSAFHIAPAIVAIAVAFGLYRLAKKRSRSF